MAGAQPVDRLVGHDTPATGEWDEATDSGGRFGRSGAGCGGQGMARKIGQHLAGCSPCLACPRFHGIQNIAIDVERGSHPFDP
jgi:hypothetical protein